MNSSTSFPVSAHECADSATIDADPVSTAATVFAAAISPFARRATSTVTTDSGRSSASSSRVDVPAESIASSSRRPRVAQRSRADPSPSPS